MHALISPAVMETDGTAAVIGVSGLTRRRARVARGTTAAQVAVGLAIPAVAWGLVAQYMPSGRALRFPLLALLLLGIWKAVRFTGAMRRGHRAAAALALVACAAHAVMLLGNLAGLDDWAMFAYARGSADGFAESAAAGLQGPGLFAVDVAVLLAVAGSRVGSWLRQQPLVRYAPLRWAILVLTAVTAEVLAYSGVNWLVSSGVEPWAVTASIETMLLVGLVLAAAVESRHGRRPGDVAAWEPRARRDHPRVFTGRHRVRVLALLILSAVALVTCYAAKQSGLALQTAVLGLGAVALYVRASRWAMLSAAEIRARDPRAPVLYLRSFDDDRRRVWAHGSPRRAWLERWLLWIFRRRERFEAVVGWHLWDIGPVTTVGRPSERLAPLGAAREYLDQKTWETEIEQRIQEAAAIVVVLGRTDGLLTELHAIERLGATPRMILLVPPLTRAEAARRWDAFAREAAQLRWPLPDPASHPRMLAGLLQPDRTWVIIAGNRGDEYDYEVAIETARTLRVEMSHDPDSPPRA